MNEEIRRALSDADQGAQRVLIEPTEDELRAAADRLRREGKLYCTRCRKPIRDERFVTRRISFGPRLQAAVNLHPECDEQATAQEFQAAETRTAVDGGTSYETQHSNSER